MKNKILNFLGITLRISVIVFFIGGLGFIIVNKVMEPDPKKHYKYEIQINGCNEKISYDYSDSILINGSCVSYFSTENKFVTQCGTFKVTLINN